MIVRFHHHAGDYDVTVQKSLTLAPVPPSGTALIDGDRILATYDANTKSWWTTGEVSRATLEVGAITVEA